MLRSASTNRTLLVGCAIAALCSAIGQRDACAQRIRFSDPVPVAPYIPPAQSFPSANTVTTNSFPASPQTTFSNNGAPIAAPPMQLQSGLPPLQGTTTLPFDAYGGANVGASGGVILGPGTTIAPQTQFPNSTGVTVYPPANAYPWVGPDPATTGAPPPGTYPAPGTYPGYFSGQSNVPPIYGPSAYGHSQWPESPGAWPNQAWARVRDNWWPRLIEHPRLRHTYISGDRGTDLSINDAELATTLTLPNFLFAQTPLRVSPGFIFHFWDGPDTGVTGVDLPSKAYSTYLAFDYLTPMNQAAGAEVNFTIGVYTDFDHVTTDSIRLTGVGLGWIRLDNTTTLKLGVEYLDRLDVKILPAAGFFLMPTSDIKLDLYFPRPKIAQRAPNFRNAEVWVYIGAEYGGGSWTIERMGGMGDQVDINDVRVFIGTEWLGRRNVTGFFEGGYVFDRELDYASLPGNIDLSDAFMIRSGLSF